MSPSNKIKLNKIRKKLDALDNSLIKIIKKRTNLVKKVLSLKESKNEIIDHKRINMILSKIKKNRLKIKLIQKLRRIWLNMIYAYIDYEKEISKKNNYLL